ncbi:MAG: hypothetical protein RM338_26710 [Nostoc sp. DedQUE12a]|nr:hypothetical protein [Nostoc sp. DedQUE12a]
MEISGAIAHQLQTRLHCETQLGKYDCKCQRSLKLTYIRLNRFYL